MESPLRSPKRLKLDQDQEHHHEAEPTKQGPAPLSAEDPLPPPPPPPPPPRQFKCRRFSTPQGCAFGDSCLFGHPSAPPAPGNELSSSSNLNKPIKPCTKFFSTSGCPYGKGCHFAHYVPRAGLASIAMVGVGAAGEEKLMGALKLVNMPETGVNLGEYKSRLCNWFGTPEGCRYGEKCHFAHGEDEILHRLEGGGSKDLCVSAPHDAKPTNVIKHSGMELRQENARGHNCGCTTSSARQPTSSSKTAAAAAFGTSTRAIISIDADLAGPIIGRNGMHTKQIRRLTGAKITIREHESDVKLRVVEMEGSFEQIKQAGVMVRQVLLHALIRGPSRLASLKLYKSKVCKNFPGGTCTFGSRCHFVHAGAAAAHAEAHETTTVAEA